jgi:hypothetical protein
MARQTAYRLRCRKQGQAFAIAWDAAMLIAARVLVDQAVDLSLYGSIETVTRPDKDTVIKRRQTSAMLFAAIERMRSPKILGTPAAIAASEDWDRCLDLLEMGLPYEAEVEGDEAELDDMPPGDDPAQPLHADEDRDPNPQGNPDKAEKPALLLAPSAFADPGQRKDGGEIAAKDEPMPHPA